MNTQQMEYFLDIAQTENMTESAKRLHVAQPSLNKSIARLEAEIGAPLFDRAGRGLRLNAAGRAAKQHIEGALAEISQAKAKVARLKQGETALLGVEVGAASRVAVRALSQWMPSHPAVNVRVTQKPGELAQPAVYIASHHVAGSVEERTYRERIMLAVPAYGEGEDEPVQLEDLERAGFIATASRFGLRRVCDDICARLGVSCRVTFESDNPGVVREMIALGLGVGFWPERSWGLPDGVRLLPIASDEFGRSVSVALTAAGSASPAARDLFAHVCATFERAFSDA